MKLLFITLLDFRDIHEHNIYSDLMREFVMGGHEVFIVSPTERRNRRPTEVLKSKCDEVDNFAHILKLKTGNIQKTNIIEKGISTILLEFQLKAGIKRYFNGVKFDVVLYSTPPITLIKPIEYIKKRDAAKCYLMLKDIFPQNAIDIGMMTDKGLKSLMYRAFRKKEKRLYAISDKIGCMSQANVDYLLEHNPEIDTARVEVCPNAIEVANMTISDTEKNDIRMKYGIPREALVFVYGGNLGRPQGIPFIIECLKSQRNNEDVFFLVVGDGTEFSKLKEYSLNTMQKNFKLLQHLPKKDYDKMVMACDVGMVFLDHRFTIPNFPSRLLSYMQASLPVLACTDTCTDVGKIIVEGGFGWWCESNDIVKFNDLVVAIQQENLCNYRRNSFEFLVKNYTSNKTYNTIVASIEKICC